MDGGQFWEVVGPLIREYWPEATFSIVCLVFGSWWGKRRANRQWARKEFLDRLNVSLNMIRDGTLQIRTILEKDLESVLLNKVAVDKLLAATLLTTEKNPLLPLDDDAWYMLNAVLNEISERFADGQIRKDVGKPVESVRYLICLTFENSGAMRTRKVRAMMMRKDAFLSLPDEVPKLESPLHETRYWTLRQLATEYEKNPKQFLDVEICV